MGHFSVTFWGVRGSHATPGKDTVKFGGNSTCLEVNAGGNILVFDAGGGIINLGASLRDRHLEPVSPDKRESLTVYLFFTHTHHDHTEGLPFFEPAYYGKTVMNIFGPRMLSSDLEDVLAHAMVPPFFPISMEDMGAQKVIQNISERNQVIIAEQDAPPQIINKATGKHSLSSDAVVISAMKDYNHPRDGVLIYSIEYAGKRVVFATDVEGYIGGDQKLIGFAHGADLLIHDSQYTYEVYADSRFPKQGWGHSTVEMAAEVALKAKVKQLALTHHDPLETDRMVELKELHAQKLFKNTIAAYEGLTVIL